MATIMQLYKTPPHGEKEDGGMDDYKKKLFHHRAGQGIRFLVCVVVVRLTSSVITFCASAVAATNNAQAKNKNFFIVFCRCGAGPLVAK